MITITTPEEFSNYVQQLGFSDMNEFNDLISSASIDTPEKMLLFKLWQTNDGTKNGL